MEEVKAQLRTVLEVRISRRAGVAYSGGDTDGAARDGVAFEDDVAHAGRCEAARAGLRRCCGSEGPQTAPGWPRRRWREAVAEEHAGHGRAAIFADSGAQARVQRLDKVAHRGIAEALVHRHRIDDIGEQDYGDAAAARPARSASA
jgi:hypothetical protein